MSKQAPPQVRPKSIDALIPYARNARTHSDEQVSMIAASLVEFGWTNPVLVGPDGGVIAGHGRLLAARKVQAAGGAIPNWPDTAQVPTIELAHLTKAQRRAYVLADNQLATKAGWDFEALAVELDELRDEGFDLSLLGFEPGELNDLIGTPNAGPPPEEKPFDYQEKFAVLIDCADEAEQAGTFEKLQAQGYTCKVLVN